MPLNLIKKRPQIESYLAEWDSLTNIENGYFSNYELQSWVEKCPIEVKKVWRITLYFRGLDYPYRDKLLKLKRILQNSTLYRNEFNYKFLEHELSKYRSLFNDIEGSSLDKQQRLAAVLNEDNTLVIAGAGTGKTKTILARISYLFKKFDLDKDQLLLISFTNKTCDEMRNLARMWLDPSLPQNDKRAWKTTNDRHHNTHRIPLTGSITGTLRI